MWTLTVHSVTKLYKHANYAYIHAQCKGKKSEVKYSAGMVSL